MARTSRPPSSKTWPSDTKMSGFPMPSKSRVSRAARAGFPPGEALPEGRQADDVVAVAVGDEDVFHREPLRADLGLQPVDGTGGVDERGLPALGVVKEIAIDLDRPHDLAHDDRLGRPRARCGAQDPEEQDGKRPDQVFHGDPSLSMAR
jgi:hypothetical protein